MTQTRPIFSPPLPTMDFERRGALERTLPRVPMARLPTPVEEVADDELAAARCRLFLKRDDRCGEPSGGAKLRKLEFVVGEARARRAQRLITTGFVGSDHAAMTARWAAALGLRASLHLWRRKGLLAEGASSNVPAGSAVRTRTYRSAGALAAGLAWDWLTACGRCERPFYIPAGGSSPAGVAGFVLAAFELQEQVNAGLLPPPDLLYIPAGSMGAAAGLTLGLSALEGTTRLQAVRVVEPAISPDAKLFRLCRRTAAWLRRRNAPLDVRRRWRDVVDLRSDALGSGFARPTAASRAAAEWLRARCGIELDGAYSAKAFAALLGDLRTGPLRGRTAVFWLTHDSRPSPPSPLCFDSLPLLGNK